MNVLIRRLNCVLLTYSLAAGIAEAAKPRLVLVGDSTVKNGRGDGAGGLWGWGNLLAEQFDPARIEIENRALGGRSSRTYQTEGHWERSLERLRPGDFVLIQFGHNDGGQHFDGDRPRASLKGNTDDSKNGVVQMTGKEETVHSYGWYIRIYVADAKERGATPIVLSLVPRNIWKDGHVVRAAGDYGKWAAEAARQAGAAFIDLNEIVAFRYEAEGEETVRRDYFTAADHTHTTEAGAQVSAACVAEGIRRLVDVPLREFLLAPAPTRDSYELDYRAGAPLDFYTPQRGYGFEPGSEPTGEGPQYYSLQLPEGNYRVVATCRTADGGPLTVKAELRRLMVERVCVPHGQTARVEFTVNVRRPTFAEGAVRLKDRERTYEAAAWDEKLTLEFNARKPRLVSLSVRPAPEAVTVYLAGDSTVCDQALEPWNSWGQMLPRFFRPGVAIANHAESGETLRSFLGERRMEKIFSLIRPKDYLFIQFGHNDFKDKSPDALGKYRSNLKLLVDRARLARAHPVLVTSMEHKKGFDRGTLGDYPQTVRDVARELKVPLIDLEATSKTLYRSLGNDLPAAFVDDTHHTSYGSYLLAQCVVAGIREAELPLAERLSDDAPALELRCPPPFRAFDVPPSKPRDAAVAARPSN